MSNLHLFLFGIYPYIALTVFVGGVGPFRATLRDTVPDGDGLVLNEQNRDRLQ
jgi:hypothetical protein